MAFCLSFRIFSSSVAAAALVEEMGRELEMAGPSLPLSSPSPGQQATLM